MRERLLRIGILAGALFAINVVGRLVARIWFEGEFAAEDRTGLVTLVGIGVAMAAVAISWARVRPMGVVVADLAGGAVAAGALILLVGPFVSGATPAEIGMGDSFTAAWQYAGFAAGGALAGVLVLITIGKDYKSVSLKRYAESKLTKPRRPVRG